MCRAHPGCDLVLILESRDRRINSRPSCSQRINRCCYATSGKLMTQKQSQSHACACVPCCKCRLKGSKTLQHRIFCQYFLTEYITQEKILCHIRATLVSRNHDLQALLLGCFSQSWSKLGPKQILATCGRSLFDKIFQPLHGSGTHALSL